MKTKVLSDYEKARRDIYAPLVDRVPPERHENIFIFGLSCGTGWKDIIFNLVQEMDKIWTGYKKQNGRDCWKIRQVKEKFGGLVFYPQYPEDLGDDAKARREQCSAAIDFAEAQAWKTCERCGKPGQVISVQFRMATVCDECKERWKKRVVEERDDPLYG